MNEIKKLAMEIVERMRGWGDHIAPQEPFIYLSSVIYGRKGKKLPVGHNARIGGFCDDRGEPAAIVNCGDNAHDMARVSMRGQAIGLRVETFGKGTPDNPYIVAVYELTAAETAAVFAHHGWRSGDMPRFA